MNKKVAYLTHTYPVYSTTFSVAEVTELRERGVHLTVFSLRRPQEALVTEALQKEFARTSFVRPVSILRLLGAHLSVAIRQPVVYARTALQCVRANAVNVQQTLKGILHFLEAVDLGERLVQQQYACMHVQFADTAATYAAVINRLHKLPFSVAVHAHDLFEHRFTNRLIAFRIRDAAWIRVISRFNRDYLQEKTGMGHERIEIVRCGIDISTFRRLGSRESVSRPLILSVGRLVPYKGHDVLIRACRQLKDWGLDPVCEIVGEGTEREELSDLIEELDLKGNVNLVGVLPHDEIRRLLEAATLFVLACRRADDGAMDGIPVALMEAMAMELPVVTTAISGIPELVEHNHTGLIAATDDPADFARQIREVIADTKLAERLGRTAREKVEAEFNQRTIGSVLADRICLSTPSS